jgi:phosphate transport system ATP-binding protein
MTKPIFDVRDLSVHAGRRTLLDSVRLQIPQGGVFGLIGPSGAGKSTLLKSLNRMLDLTPGLSVSGQVDFHGSPLYHRSVNPDALRTRIGMLFQQPVVFPGSILANVTFGIRHHGTVPRCDLPRVAEEALRDACLWDEVKDRLNSAATTLSIGQQQRLCLARTLACSPEVVLMDEPTSALDPRSIAAVEELIQDLAKNITIILVTHNHAQAEKVCRNIVRLDSGRIEAGEQAISPSQARAYGLMLI